MSKRKIFMILVFIFILFVFVYLFFFFNKRQTIRIRTISINGKKISALENKNEVNPIFFLNENYKNYKSLTVSKKIVISKHEVDLSSVSLIKGNVELKNKQLIVSGKEVLLGLFNINKDKNLTIDSLQIDFISENDIGLYSFILKKKNSLYKKAKEMIREIFIERYGVLVSHNDVKGSKKKQKVSIILNLRQLKNTKELDQKFGIILKINNKKSKPIRIKKISFVKNTKNKIEQYPSCSYFKFKKKLTKSVFLPQSAKIIYEIKADKPVYFDGALGTELGRDAKYIIKINGEIILKKTVTKSFFFSYKILPVNNKIKLEINVLKNSNSYGVLENFTFYKNIKAKKNIIFYLIDTLRGDLGGIEKPLFKKNFKQGAVFKNAYSNATNTANAIPVIFSGEYKFNLVSYLKDSPFLDKKEFLLTEYLKTKGYTTVTFIANAWLVQSNSHQGFDNVFFCWGDKTKIGIYPTQKNYINFKYGNMTKYIKEFIKLNKNKPLFIYIQTIEPHIPYELPLENRDYSKNNNKVVNKSIYGNFEDNLSSPNKEQIDSLLNLYRDNVLVSYKYYMSIDKMLKSN